MRANSHRPVAGGGGLELASSPDTPRRERWQWHLRVDHPGDGGPTITLPGEDREITLALDFDAERVSGTLEALTVEGSLEVQRDEQELVVLVVAGGRVRVEQRHTLGVLDVMVIEGDDPFTVTVDPLDSTSTSLGVARLRPVDAARIVWVP